MDECFQRSALRLPENVFIKSRTKGAGFMQEK